jgi:6-phosphogluconolactonase
MAGPDLEILPDADSVAARAAELVAELARDAVADHGSFRFAVSGGKTPWAMFARLSQLDVPWDRLSIYQVDERIAPAGDPDRNLTHLIASLPVHADADIHAMPVEDDDVEAAAGRYATDLPEAFDLVHLGLGPDGHTASLIPGDPVLGVTDRLVAVTGVYQGRQRMTLTYPALARARTTLFLITGADKAGPLAQLLAHDPSIPAGRVDARDLRIVADASAAPTG